MRFFVELAYNGTPFSGWQRQPNAATVQSTLEDAFSMILRSPIQVTGCGRTDTGVHAKQYFMHFDFLEDFPKHFLDRLNKVLPFEIAIRRIFEVKKDTHARFDAYHRSYEYHLVLTKNPFDKQTTYFFPFEQSLDIDKMNAAAKLLLNYNEFFPFCKTNTEVKTMICDLKRSEWVVEVQTGKLIYHVSSNRFLRGMIRLIVGMCLNVGTGKIELKEVQEAMEQQTRLDKSWSVPPQGLFLCDIRYPL
ncbi:MAG: tRNA pseudouridine38-40 synthase [Paraglaciecola sp.]|jgi:tRNA pseudouridine38-40 synthase